VTRTLGAVALGVAVVALLSAGIGLGARYLSISNHAYLIAAVLSPYLLAGAPISLVLLLLRRRWILATSAFAVLVAVVAVEYPLYTHQDNRIDAVRVRVMTANLYLGSADAKSIVAKAENEADVLALQELTPRAVERLTAAGLNYQFPYRILDARDYASGAGLWSRYPITQSERIRGYELAMVSAHIHVPGVARDPRTLVAHLSGPWPQPLDDWQHDMEQLRSTMREVAQSAGPGCALLAGDFNSTLDVRPFRDLVRNGYHDAAEQAGAGITATYPANTWTPPLIAIDHVLTYQCTAVSAKTTELAGSDHRGLVSTVEVPR
jgi:endonuclease/exonuclease/phosphatase (EEP) superfamily protein YafD